MLNVLCSFEFFASLHHTFYTRNCKKYAHILTSQSLCYYDKRFEHFRRDKIDKHLYNSYKNKKSKQIRNQKKIPKSAFVFTKSLCGQNETKKNLHTSSS